MIELGQGESLVENTKDGSRKYENKLKRIDFCDKRVYQRAEGLYYPSVTSILGAAPVDPFFLRWVEEVGKNAEIIRNQAGIEGTAVHEAMEQLALGKTIDWKDEFGNARYSLKVWQMILRGADFFNTVKPKILASEQFLFSDKYQYAGTTDLLTEVNTGDDKREKWLLDFKTSNHVSLTYSMQLAAYAKALEEQQGIVVDRCGIVWLKAATRGPRKGAFQGEGWQIIFSDSIDDDFRAFLDIYDVFKIYNKKIEPYTKSYPTEVKLEY